MTDRSALLQRWHSLPRPDRAAVLARLDAGQRAELMAMMAAERTDGKQVAVPVRDRWSAFSPAMREILHAAEKAPDTPLPEYRLTAATAALLVGTAQPLQAEQPDEAGPLAALHRRWTHWRKDLGL